MDGGKEKFIQGFGVKPEGKTPLGRTRRGWRIIIKWIFRKWDGGLGWIDMA
jgi:hypothetical protein